MYNEENTKRKFEEVAMTPDNPNWDRAIGRQDPLYGRSDDVRSPFARDYTRILHSLAFRRLKHKTQVFFNAAGNDHICTRSEHVLHVESVSSTIANSLGLNEELTRAIAMAHDLGHAPFGHQGESILSKITTEHLGKKFWHEKNGVYFVDNIELLEDNERNLQNLNLTYAVRDGIISHCGEVNQNGIRPREDYFDILTEFTSAGQYQAATWEGCVVKLADKIAYLGRDIEDAARLGYLSADEMDELVKMARINNEMAVNTTVIMHNMIIDLCNNSSPEKGLCLSDVMAQQMDKIKAFNYKNIYDNRRMKPLNKYAELIINEVFNELRSHYEGPSTIESLVLNRYYGKKFIRDFTVWLKQYVEMDIVCNGRGDKHFSLDISRCRNKKIYGRLETEELYIQAIVDYIAGMTDIYIVNAFNEML